MKAFRFRPAHVLALRRKQHELAEAQLARAQQERDAADCLVREAAEACGCAQRDWRAQMDAVHTAVAAERHRNWIALRQAERADRQRSLGVRQLEVHRATRAVQETFMRLRALERLRDRAWRKHQLDERRHDAVEMDHLAVIRFARRSRGGIDCDD